MLTWLLETLPNNIKFGNMKNWKKVRLDAIYLLTNNKFLTSLVKWKTKCLFLPKRFYSNIGLTLREFNTSISSCTVLLSGIFHHFLKESMSISSDLLKVIHNDKITTGGFKVLKYSHTFFFNSFFNRFLYYTEYPVYLNLSLFVISHALILTIFMFNQLKSDMQKYKTI